MQRLTFVTAKDIKVSNSGNRGSMHKSPQRPSPSSFLARSQNIPYSSKRDVNDLSLWIWKGHAKWWMLCFGADDDKLIFQRSRKRPKRINRDPWRISRIHEWIPSAVKATTAAVCITTVLPLTASSNDPVRNTSSHISSQCTKIE